MAEDLKRESKWRTLLQKSLSKDANDVAAKSANDILEFALYLSRPCVSSTRLEAVFA